VVKTGFFVRVQKFNQVAIYAGVTVILLLVPFFVKSPYLLQVLTKTLIFIIAASSLRTVIISGQLSFTQAAFMGIGAYVTGVLSIRLGWMPWFTMPLGAVTTTAFAIMIGFPFTRLRAVYFALVSIFGGMLVLALISMFPAITGGSSGLIGIPTLFAGSKVANYYFFLGLTVLSLLVIWRFEFCRIGTTLKAIAQSFLVASSIGINEARYRVLALAVGGFFAGLAGAGYAHLNLALTPDDFGLLPSVYLIIYCVLGGIGSFAGPLIGTAILIIVPELFRVLKQFTPFLSAGILLIVAYVMPEGLVGLPKMVKSWWAKRREKRVVTNAP
jgi:branched-chain amino acid transport system permease protein